MPAQALADGGPVAPVQGSAIRAVGSRYSYSVSHAGRDTIVTKGGAGGASTLLVVGRYGVPGVDNNGSLTGLSADGRTLVLAELPARVPPTTTRLLVLDTAVPRRQGEACAARLVDRR